MIHSRLVAGSSSEPIGVGLNQAPANYLRSLPFPVLLGPNTRFLHVECLRGRPTAAKSQCYPRLFPASQALSSLDLASTTASSVYQRKRNKATSLDSGLLGPALKSQRKLGKPRSSPASPTLRRLTSYVHTSLLRHLYHLRLHTKDWYADTSI